MAAFFVFCLQSVTDSAALARYRVAARGSLSQYGARFVAGPGIIDTLEGEPLQGAVVLEFETLDAAHAWYRSEEYQVVIGIRLAATAGSAFIIETR